MAKEFDIDGMSFEQADLGKTLMSLARNPVRDVVRDYRGGCDIPVEYSVEAVGGYFGTISRTHLSDPVARWFEAVDRFIVSGTDEWVAEGRFTACDHDGNTIGEACTLDGAAALLVMARNQHRRELRECLPASPLLAWFDLINNRLFKMQTQVLIERGDISL